MNNINGSFSWKKDDSSSQEVMELQIATDLKIYSLDKNTPNQLARAASVCQYVEWIIDDKQDTTIKWISGFLTQQYKRNLLIVLERDALPYLLSKHKEMGGLGGMDRVEFWSLQNAIDKLKQQL